MIGSHLANNTPGFLQIAKSSSAEDIRKHMKK